jgi:hypothetical protein
MCLTLLEDVTASSLLSLQLFTRSQVLLLLIIALP